MVDCPFLELNMLVLRVMVVVQAPSLTMNKAPVAVKPRPASASTKRARRERCGLHADEPYGGRLAYTSRSDYSHFAFGAYNTCLDDFCRAHCACV